MNLEVRQLCKKFGGTVALDGVSFTLCGGGVCGFVGPNGAGKTTAIQIMAGLDVPDSGDVLYDGVSMVDFPEKVRKRIGYMPDSLPDCTDVSVNDYLEFYAGAFGMEGAAARRKIAAIEELTALGGMCDKRLDQLSKGMKQRVSLARILVHDPEVLLLDEPAAGLDPRARIELREILRKLAGEGKTIFLSSHILTELDDLCDSVVIIERGRLVKNGRLDALAEETPQEKNTVILSFADGSAAAGQLAVLREAPEVARCEMCGVSDLRVELKNADVDAFMAGLFQRHVPLAAFRRKGVRADLEELFLKTTRNEVQ